MELELDFSTWVDLRSVTQEFISSVRKRNLSWFENNMTNEKRSLSTELSKWFSMSLCDQWERNYKAAQKQLDTAEIVLRKSGKQKVTPSHLQAFQQLIATNRAQLALRDNGGKEEDQKLVCRVRIEDPETQAMILAVKAMLIGIFGDTATAVKLLDEVVRLDDGHADHWKERFLALRRHRRELNHLDLPSHKEWKAIQKALELDGNQDSPSILDGMSTLLFDYLKDTNKCEYGPERIRFEDLLQKLKSNAQKAFLTNEECSNCGIRWAEVLCVSDLGKKWQPARKKEAEVQFERCLTKWPKCSHVLHKAGKFRIMTEERDAAIELFEKSLRADGTNYPCLMDLLRRLHQRNTERDLGTEELFKLINEYLPQHKQRKLFTSKLLCLKAALLAKKHEFEEAVELWLEAIGTSPELWTKENDKKGTKRDQIFGREVLKDFLLHSDFVDLRTFVVESAEKKMDDLRKLTKLKTLRTAIDREMKLNEASNNGNWRDKPDSPSKRRVPEDKNVE